MEEATGLTSQELSDVLQENPRAYMAVRGAAAEKHLSKILGKFEAEGSIDGVRSASGDFDKDFNVEISGQSYIVECKNVQVLNLSTKLAKIDYLKYLERHNLLTGASKHEVFKKIGVDGDLADLTGAAISGLYSRLPRPLRESGLVRYQYSASKIDAPKLKVLSDEDFISQFSDAPLTIDFQRTRNASGNDKKNRFYEIGELDIVAACLFHRTLGWEFLYASATELKHHEKYADRYDSKIKLEPGKWFSNIRDLLPSLPL